MAWIPHQSFNTASDSWDTTSKTSNEGLKLKQGLVHIYSRLFLTHKKPSLKLGSYDSGNPRDGPWRITHEGKSSGRGRRGYVRCLPGKKKKTYKATSLQPKMRLWEFKVKGRVPEKHKWRPGNELGCPCLHAQETCIVMYNLQWLSPSVLSIYLYRQQSISLKTEICISKR